MDNTNGTIEQIVARATFMYNMFPRLRLLSSFQLAEGYQPSFLGLPQESITVKLLEIHKEQVAVRALQRLLRSRSGSNDQSSPFSIGDPIWMWF